jgi:uncharacterized protein YkwD
MAFRNGLLEGWAHGRRLVAWPVCALALLGSAAPAEAAGARCPYSSSRVSAVAVSKVSQATLCLINRERARHGLTALVRDARLRRAAARHARDMVRKGYFAHGTFTDRIADAGYPIGTRFLVGENLAWATGRLAAAKHVVRAWMRSPGHRHNILFPAYRAAGIGLVRGAPGHGGNGSATYVADFGSFAEASGPPSPPPQPPQPPQPPPQPPPGRGPFCELTALARPAGAIQTDLDVITLGRGLVGVSGC